MKGGNFILSILKKLEDTYPGLIAFAYVDGGGGRKWWMVCLSDFDVYFHDKRFQVLKKAWHKAGAARGMNIVFCNWRPIEKNLVKLANEENLLLNL